MRAAVVLALALALATALRLPAAWESGNALNHVSGTWMALADDLARGTLYRPIHAQGAWGGTRYFPLAFALQAGLVRAGASPVAAAYAASLAAGLLLALAVAILARRLGAGRGTAALAPLALAGFAGQHALAAGRGDLLPAALSALALAAVARRAGPGALALAALLFTLGFAAKPTALGAALAAVAFLALRGRRRAALALAALVAAGAIATVATADALSAGRFLAGLATLASGGADAGTALRAPLRLAEELVLADPAGLVLAAAGAVVLAASLRPLARQRRAQGQPDEAAPAPQGAPTDERGFAASPDLERAGGSGGREVRPARRGADRVSPRPVDPRLLPALWLAAAWAVTLAVFASPGTGVNHLVELEAASATLLASAASGPRRAGSLARAGAVAAAAAGLVLAAALFRADHAGSRLAEVRAVVRALPAGTVLSEDPLVPLLAGARPVLLDAFSLRVAADRDPALLAPLSRALGRREFAAVVLFEDPRSPAGEAWYAAGNLGLPLAREIAASYRPAASLGRYRLWLPRAAAGSAADLAREGQRQRGPRW